MVFMMLLMTVLPATLISYSICYLFIKNRRLSLLSKVVGFFSAWLMGSIIALAMAEEPNVDMASKKALQATFIASIISVSSIAFLNESKIEDYHQKQTPDTKNVIIDTYKFVLKNKAIFIALAFLLVSFSVYFFTIPSNFDDCILFNIKDAKNERAVYLINKTCRSKFPQTEEEIFLEKCANRSMVSGISLGAIREIQGYEKISDDEIVTHILNLGLSVERAILDRDCNKYIEARRGL